MSSPYDKFRTKMTQVIFDSQRAYILARMRRFHKLNISARRVGIVQGGVWTHSNPPRLQLSFVTGYERMEWNACNEALKEIDYEIIDFSDIIRYATDDELMNECKRRNLIVNGGENANQAQDI